MVLPPQHSRFGTPALALPPVLGRSGPDSPLALPWLPREARTQPRSLHPVALAARGRTRRDCRAQARGPHPRAGARLGLLAGRAAPRGRHGESSSGGGRASAKLDGYGGAGLAAARASAGVGCN
eukprot:scaffold16447_cov116-Isochrysis_galbana.AAC.6